MTRKSTDTSGFHALIVAAGVGARVGGDAPKQYIKIGGKAILRHTIDVFLRCEGLKSLRVVIHPDHQAYYEDAMRGLDLPVHIFGDKERNLSVYKGLQSFSDIDKDDKILIHDGVRPFVKVADIENVVNALDNHKVVSVGIPARDSLRENGVVKARDGIYHLQTPQGFYYGDILNAHKEYAERFVTDDGAFFEDIHIVESSFSNFKITTQDDIDMARRLLGGVRTGTGYDVHRLVEGRDLILCGVKIEHTHGLDGHSDADVGLHALTDAILGAIGAGDIGLHFPPSDDQYKNKDSAFFLKVARDMVADKGGSIQNVDVTLICEEPKITPYRDAMVARVAAILEVAEECVNIKATTSEGLGFTGRKEGIAAQAVATVLL